MIDANSVIRPIGQLRYRSREDKAADVHFEHSTGPLHKLTLA